MHQHPLTRQIDHPELVDRAKHGEVGLESRPRVQRQGELRNDETAIGHSDDRRVTSTVWPRGASSAVSSRRSPRDSTRSTTFTSARAWSSPSGGDASETNFSTTSAGGTGAAKSPRTTLVTPVS